MALKLDSKSSRVQTGSNIDYTGKSSEILPTANWPGLLSSIQKQILKEVLLVQKKIKSKEKKHTTNHKKINQD
jgi:hypothetical protein